MEAQQAEPKNIDSIVDNTTSQNFKLFWSLRGSENKLRVYDQTSEAKSEFQGPKVPGGNFLTLG